MARNVRRSSPSGKVSMERLTVTKAMGSANTATVTAVTMTCTGLLTTDVVAVNASAAFAAGTTMGHAFCSAANVLTVDVANPTAAWVAVGTVTFNVQRFPLNQ